MTIFWVRFNIGKNRDCIQWRATWNNIANYRKSYKMKGQNGILKSKWSYVCLLFFFFFVILIRKLALTSKIDCKKGIHTYWNTWFLSIWYITTNLALKTCAVLEKQHRRNVLWWDSVCLIVKQSYYSMVFKMAPCRHKLLSLEAKSCSRLLITGIILQWI